jgi:NADH:ubiquinone reductase (H+-translocating)
VKNVVVLGSGFAGLWAALAAARRLDELRIPARDVGVTVISSQAFHDIRVRNYESDLTACRVPLSAVLDPVGVAHITADVTAIDTAARTIMFSGSWPDPANWSNRSVPVLLVHRCESRGQSDHR